MSSFNFPACTTLSKSCRFKHPETVADFVSCTRDLDPNRRWRFECKFAISVDAPRHDDAFQTLGNQLRRAFSLPDNLTVHQNDLKQQNRIEANKDAQARNRHVVTVLMPHLDEFDLPNFSAEESAVAVGRLWPSKGRVLCTSCGDNGFLPNSKRSFTDKCC